MHNSFNPIISDAILLEALYEPIQLLSDFAVEIGEEQYGFPDRVLFVAVQIMSEFWKKIEEAERFGNNFVDAQETLDLCIAFYNDFQRNVVAPLEVSCREFEKRKNSSVIELAEYSKLKKRHEAVGEWCLNKHEELKAFHFELEENMNDQAEIKAFSGKVMSGNSKNTYNLKNPNMSLGSLRYVVFLVAVATVFYFIGANVS